MISMNQVQLEQKQEKLRLLNLSPSMKEYLLNCDNDGILTRKDADYLKSIGKWFTMETRLN